MIVMLNFSTYCLLLIAIVQTVRAVDESIASTKFDDIQSRLERADQIELNSYIDLMIEHANLRKEILANGEHVSDSLIEKIADIDRKINGNLISLRVRLATIRDPEIGSNLRAKLESLHAMFDPCEPELDETFRNLRTWFVSNRLNDIFLKISNHYATGDRQVSSSSSSSRDQMNGYMKEYMLMQNDSMLSALKEQPQWSDKISKMDLIIVGLKCLGVHGQLMREKSTVEISVDNLNRGLETIFSRDQEFLRNMSSKSEPMADKLIELHKIWNMKANVNKCNETYWDEYIQLKRQYNAKLNVHTYLDEMKSEQISVCSVHIEDHIKSLISEYSDIDSAMARFGQIKSTFSYILIQRIVDDFSEPTDLKGIGLNLTAYLKTFGYQLPQKKFDEAQLRNIDEGFNLYIARYCQRLSPLDGNYKFAKRTMKRIDRRAEFGSQTKVLVFALNICGRIKGTRGRDWVLATSYDHKSFKDILGSSSRKNEDSSVIFDHLENLIHIGPSLNKIFGQTEELEASETCKKIIKLARKSARKYKPHDISGLKELIVTFGHAQGVHRALRDLQKEKITEIIKLLHEDVVPIMKSIENSNKEALETFIELRHSLEKNILKKRKISPQNRVIEIVRKGIDRSTFEQVIDKQVSEAKRRRINGRDRQDFDQAHAERLKSSLRQTCHSFMSEPRVERIFALYWSIQVDELYIKLSDFEVDFMVEYIMCRDFPYPGESSNAGARTELEVKQTEMM